MTTLTSIGAVVFIALLATACGALVVGLGVMFERWERRRRDRQTIQQRLSDIARGRR